MRDPKDDEVIECGNGISVGGGSLMQETLEKLHDPLTEAAFREAIDNLPSVSDAPPGVFQADE